MRIVLDTNILLSGLAKQGSPPDLIRRSWEAGRLTLVTSDWQIEEFRRVSRYPKLEKYLKPHEVGWLVLRLRSHAVVLKALPPLELSHDPDDNPLLATAIVGEADYLVTGDKHDLLMLGKVYSIPILTARTFLSQLR